jgi:hypothetical protein
VGENQKKIYFNDIVSEHEIENIDSPIYLLLWP